MRSLSTVEQGTSPSGYHRWSHVAPMVRCHAIRMNRPMGGRNTMLWARVVPLGGGGGDAGHGDDLDVVRTKYFDSCWMETPSNRCVL